MFWIKYFAMLAWPSESLKINPIENLLQGWKTDVRKHTRANLTEFVPFWKEEWTMQMKAYFRRLEAGIILP